MQHQRSTGGLHSDTDPNVARPAVDCKPSREARPSGPQLRVSGARFSGSPSHTSFALSTSLTTQFGARWLMGHLTIQLYPALPTLYICLRPGPFRSTTNFPTSLLLIKKKMTKVGRTGPTLGLVEVPSTSAT